MRPKIEVSSAFCACHVRPRPAQRPAPGRARAPRARGPRLLWHGPRIVPARRAPPPTPCTAETRSSTPGSAAPAHTAPVSHGRHPGSAGAQARAPRRPPHAACTERAQRAGAFRAAQQCRREGRIALKKRNKNTRKNAPGPLQNPLLEERLSLVPEVPAAARVVEVTRPIDLLSPLSALRRGGGLRRWRPP